MLFQYLKAENGFKVLKQQVSNADCGKSLYSEAFKDLPQSAFDAFVGEFEASLEKQDKEMEEKGHNAPVDTVSTVDSLKQAAEQRAAKRK